jgi:hypothetical protein
MNERRNLVLYLRHQEYARALLTFALLIINGASSARASSLLFHFEVDNLYSFSLSSDPVGSPRLTNYGCESGFSKGACHSDDR